MIYDPSGNVIGKLVYKYEDEYYRPYEGTEYIFLYGSTDVSIKREYKNGEIIAERFYNEETHRLEMENFYVEKDFTLKQSVFYDEVTGAKKGELNYKDGVPYDGVFYSMLSETVYKNGRIVKSKNYSADQNLISVAELSADGSQYNGKVYDEKGKLSLTYVSDAYADGFDAVVTQYENDKAVRTAKIKNSIFAEGKIVLETLTREGGI